MHGAKTNREQGTHGGAGARHGDLRFRAAAGHWRAAVRRCEGLRTTTPSANGSGGRRDAHRGLNRPEARQSCRTTTASRLICGSADLGPGDGTAAQGLGRCWGCGGGLG
jgi:hypothetical protein